ncbi:hypothetical protein [Cyanothece sp. BG0011]|uniref:hypothetical protein n=1 Tax=Cyanothece sp. BG0011 TaxID=2082950 RepID=UPI000D1F2519|nr:hypothetical protein [Cyanothece sp. BG0011]
MSKLIIKDLEFQQTELPHSRQIEGQGNLNGIKWDSLFDFDWAHNRRDGWAVGDVTAWGLAIGEIIIPTFNFNSSI